MKMIVFDLDNVLADTHKTLASKIFEKYGFSISDETYWRKEGQWWTKDEYPDLKRIIRDIFSESGFFKNLPLIPGALKHFKSIVSLCDKKGITPLIVTAPATKYVSDAEEDRNKLVFVGSDEKYEWVKSKLPFFPISNLIITSGKTPLVSNAIAVVEDDLVLLHKVRLSSGDKKKPTLVCYRRFWNDFEGMKKTKGTLGIKDAANWAEVAKFLKKIIK